MPLQETIPHSISSSCANSSDKIILQNKFLQVKAVSEFPAKLLSALEGQDDCMECRAHCESGFITLCTKSKIFMWNGVKGKMPFCGLKMFTMSTESNQRALSCFIMSQGSSVGMLAVSDDGFIEYWSNPVFSSASSCSNKLPFSIDSAHHMARNEFLLLSAACKVFHLKVCADDGNFYFALNELNLLEGNVFTRLVGFQSKIQKLSIKKNSSDFVVLKEKSIELWGLNGVKKDSVEVLQEISSRLGHNFCYLMDVLVDDCSCVILIGHGNDFNKLFTSIAVMKGFDIESMKIIHARNVPALHFEQIKQFKLGIIMNIFYLSYESFIFYFNGLDFSYFTPFKSSDCLLEISTDLSSKGLLVTASSGVLELNCRLLDSHALRKEYKPL